MQVSDRMVEILRSTRDALDAAVNLCWSLVAVAVVSGIALYDETGLWWLCAAALLLATVAYKGAVIAAQAYSGLMHVVYDLHRFELLDALRLPLPADEEQERQIFAEVSATFSGRGRPGVAYEHGSRRSDPDDADDSAYPENMDGQAG